jgi:hypothetical protein
MVTCEPSVRSRELNANDFSGDSVPLNLTRAVLEFELRQVVENANLSVFLLTGNAELSEIVVTACVEAIDVEELTIALPSCAVRLALQLQLNGQEQAANINLTTRTLPADLDCVFRRPCELSHVCVFRLLTGAGLRHRADTFPVDGEYIYTSIGMTALEPGRAVAPKTALSGGNLSQASPAPKSAPGPAGGVRDSEPDHRVGRRPQPHSSGRHRRVDPEPA